jgi:hypothetical protein
MARSVGLANHRRLHCSARPAWRAALVEAAHAERDAVWPPIPAFTSALKTDPLRSLETPHPRPPKKTILKKKLGLESIQTHRLG